jgi:hypothetical protein
VFRKNDLLAVYRSKSARLNAHCDAPRRKSARQGPTAAPKKRVRIVANWSARLISMPRPCMDATVVRYTNFLSPFGVGMIFCARAMNLESAPF